MTKNNNAGPRERKYLRKGALAALILVGAGALASLAVFNANAKPNRDMKWYVRDGALQVAAPPVDAGYAATAAVAAGGGEGEGALAVPEAGDVTVSVPEADAPGAEEETAPPTARGAEEETASSTAPEAALDSEPAAEYAAAPEAGPLAELYANPGEDEDEDEDGAQAQASGPVTLTITAAGDCTLGGEVGAAGRRNFVRYVEDYGYDYFFEGVRDIFAADDLTIVNLEGPLTSSTRKARTGGYIFKGEPEYVGILSGSSVELCNVANNHSLDYGKAGLQETVRILEENGIGYSGYSQAWYGEIKGVRVGSLGFTRWDHDKADVAKAVAEARPNCDLLIVSMHWGTEGHHETDAHQRAMGHAAIDAGADLVIGTHPHVYQGIEKYKGKYIVYSLGNFCFGGNADPSDQRCLIFQQSFSFTPGMGIVQAGLMDAGINIIPATVSSEKQKNNFQPTVMPAESGAKLLKYVASYSSNFSLSDTLWMADNYMAANGLLQAEDDGEAARTADVRAEDADDIGADSDDASAA